MSIEFDSKKCPELDRVRDVIVSVWPYMEKSREFEVRFKALIQLSMPATNTYSELLEKATEV